MSLYDHISSLTAQVDCWSHSPLHRELDIQQLPHGDHSAMSRVVSQQAFFRVSLKVELILFLGHSTADTHINSVVAVCGREA